MSTGVSIRSVRSDTLTRITDKTRELDGMMLTLRLWGMRHCGLDPQAESAVTMTHRRTGAIIGADWQPPKRTCLSASARSKVE